MEHTKQSVPDTSSKTKHPLPDKSPDSGPGSLPERQERADWWFRSGSQWFIVGGTAIAGFFFLSFLVWHTLYPAPADGWLIRVLENHYAATIGVPLSAITAFCIVSLLHVISRGDIEFSFLGFTLKGAAGPVILWVICFMAVILGPEVLWDNG